MPGPVKTRTYDNARRAAAARRTEQRVVETAQRLLLERGYAGLAMADLAAEAGVSVPLLYKVFGPKPQLVKRIYDVLLAGDVDPEPVAERPALQALAADPDPRGKLARYAALGRAMAERAGPLVSALLTLPGPASRSCGRSRPPSTGSGWPAPRPWPPIWPSAAPCPPPWRWTGPAT